MGREGIISTGWLEAARWVAPLEAALKPLRILAFTAALAQAVLDTCATCTPPYNTTCLEVEGLPTWLPPGAWMAGVGADADVEASRKHV